MKCKECGYYSSTKEGMVRHLKNSHPVSVKSRISYDSPSSYEYGTPSDLLILSVLSSMTFDDSSSSTSSSYSSSDYSGGGGDFSGAGASDSFGSDY